MKNIDQIRVGITRFFDAEVRPALPATKGIIYGMIIGAAMANPQKMIERFAPGAQMLSIMDEAGGIDVGTLLELLKGQMKAGGGKLEFEIGINPMNPADKDRFAFTPSDVAKLEQYINGA